MTHPTLNYTHVTFYCLNDCLSGYYTIQDYKFVLMFLRNVRLYIFRVSEFGLGGDWINVKNCCWSELQTGKWEQILYPDSSVKDLCCQSFYIINPFPFIHFSLCITKFSHPEHHLSSTSSGSLNTLQSFPFEYVRY